MGNFLRVSGVILLASAAWPAAAAQDFNPYILRAVAKLNAERANGGYDIQKAFTHDIPYGGGFVKKTSGAPAPAPSMCVAAVTETILTAINLYAADTGDKSPYAKAPLPLWARGTELSLRANFFMYAEVTSNGTGHTLARFGMGEELPFEKLVPGDFINFNRSNNSGHNVVFLGYLDGRGAPLPTSTGAKGFKYFSAQGKGRSDAGFGYRWAFFQGTCPALPTGQVRDCNIKRTTNSRILNAGRLWMPSKWTVTEKITEMRNKRLAEMTGKGIPTRSAEIELDTRELPDRVPRKYDDIGW
ncbi:hypothetical protein ATE69_06700 [Sphingopyxis sp. H071]|nr:hypothetical protein ATE61_10785 [Sphingopyxis sp. H057]KTE53560.1 hypothetical protein ATE64_06715 [Sphingopyxis sp. H073]KTE56153.1 hypothetical protein ATE69_06700 [Sphingopyxis sp. H071]KTE61846.1 hypothetical protein ATE66_03555 [Sphingopyxis sp. H107]KTE67119.1 hypothetical protein ATE65_03560 [Sphingopyxis sp. H100]KTE74560.1 hypothetical protein ATE60_00625 [Sphingopyxis sp. H081]KTE81612.1 hypothetical protein ATE63_06085 [Sphingopyxis sp. H067]